MAAIPRSRAGQYPRAALASFTSLAIGHNVGVAALSSGAVRYRFYSRWALMLRRSPS